MPVLKPVAKLVSLVGAVPALLWYGLESVVMDRSRAFIGGSERVAKIPGHWGVYVRQAYYRRVLAHTGGNIYFGHMSFFSKPEATVGDRVYIGRFCTIGNVQIGDDVMLADGVQVLSGQHQHGAESDQGQALRDNPQQFDRVCIGQGAWLGAGCIVMADVGSRAVVGAGAVVTRPVPEGARVGGVPAKPLGATSA